MSPAARALRSCLLALLLPGHALAQATPPDARSASVARLEEANQLAAAGSAAEACAKYAESYSLDAQLDALLPLADCFEKSGKLASAHAAFQDAAAVAQRAGDTRWVVAGERAQKLRPRLSYLTVEVPQARRLPALSVERDGFRLGSSAWGVPAAVDPGQHLVSVSAYGYKPWQTTIDVQGEGASPYVEVPQLEKLSDEPPAAPATSAIVAEPAATPAAPQPSAPVAVQAAPMAPPPPSASTAPPDKLRAGLTPTRVAALAAGGVGLVSMGFGFYFLAQTSSTLRERDGICPSGRGCAPGTNAHLAELTQHAQNQQRAEIACFAVAGAAVALGAGLWFLPTKKPTGDRAAYLLPVVQPSGGGLVLGGRL